MAFGARRLLHLTAAHLLLLHGTVLGCMDPRYAATYRAERRALSGESKNKDKEVDSGRRDVEGTAGGTQELKITISRTTVRTTSLWWRSWFVDEEYNKFVVKHAASLLVFKISMILFITPAVFLLQACSVLSSPHQYDNIFETHEDKSERIVSYFMTPFLISKDADDMEIDASHAETGKPSKKKFALAFQNFLNAVRMIFCSFNLIIFSIVLVVSQNVLFTVLAAYGVMSQLFFIILNALFYYFPNYVRTYVEIWYDYDYDDDEDDDGNQDVVEYDYSDLSNFIHKFIMTTSVVIYGMAFVVLILLPVIQVMYADASLQQTLKPLLLFLGLSKR